jgi:hypothetical protein
MDSLVPTDPLMVSADNLGHLACRLVSVAQVMGARGQTHSKALLARRKFGSIDYADHIGGFTGDQHDIFGAGPNTFVRQDISPGGPPRIRGERHRTNRDDLQHLAGTSI